MPRNIKVVNDSSHIKKSAAQLLIRRLLAEWVIFNVSIRRLSVREYRPGAPIEQMPRTNYIPTKLPPREVPNCRFQEPQSATWKEQHRGGQFPQVI